MAGGESSRMPGHAPARRGASMGYPTLAPSPRPPPTTTEADLRRWEWRKSVRSASRVTRVSLLAGAVRRTHVRRNRQAYVALLPIGHRLSCLLTPSVESSAAPSNTVVSQTRPETFADLTSTPKIASRVQPLHSKSTDTRK